MTHAVAKAAVEELFMPVMSGHSGNEIYCLNLKQLEPGDLVLGNSVYSMGLIGGIGWVPEHGRR